MNRIWNQRGEQPDMNAEKALAQSGFVMTDLVLYLDTHPDDREALDYFAASKAQYEMASRAYSEQYGPVSIMDANPADGWLWGTTPWPWEE